MPFKEQTMSETRKQFVEEVLKGKETKRALCERYGISRPTGDKWIKRYQQGEGMQNHSQRPHNMPRQTDAQMERQILFLRAEHPALGAKKIRRILQNKGATPPAASTINAILKRNGCISEAASEAARPYKRFVRPAPNQLWQTDFKGHFGLGDESRCHPLCVIDDHSRYCLGLDARANEQLSGVWETFVKAFKKYGLPDAILCDNGNPWGTNYHQSYTQFERLLLDLDIHPLHGRPHHPQTQGKCERFNQTLKRELLARASLQNLQDAQRQFASFQRFYNEERPHHALGLATPASRYTPSERPYPETVEPWVYAEGLRVRCVKETGYMYYRGKRYFLSRAFGELQIAIRPAAGQEGCLEVLYRNWSVAVVNVRTGEVTRALRRVTDSR